MLVLTRKRGQSLVIGADVRVTVLEVSGDSVRIGIEAPAEVAIYREEIYWAVREENLAALAGRELAAEIGAQAKKAAGEKAAKTVGKKMAP